MAFIRRKKQISRRNAIDDASRRPVTRPEEREKATFAYYQNRNTDDMVKANRKRDVKGLFSHVPTVLAGIAIIISLMYALTLSSAPQIKIVNEQNNRSYASFLRTNDVYKDSISKKLHGSVFNQNKLTINTDALGAELAQEFPEIVEVAVVLPIVSRTPVVYIRVAEPALLLKTTSGNFVIDEKGRAIVNEQEVSKDSELKLLSVDDKAGLDVSIGAQTLPRRDVDFITEVRKQFGAKSIVISRMELPALANELYVFIEGKPYYVKFTTSNDARQQIGAFLATKADLERRNVLPGQYVDVRVEERVYYL